MSKKNYVKMDVWNTKLTASGADKLNLEINGKSTSGTDVVVNAKLDLYDLTNTIIELKKIALSRLDQARRNVQTIEDAVK